MTQHIDLRLRPEYQKPPRRLHSGRQRHRAHPADNGHPDLFRFGEGGEDQQIIQSLGNLLLIESRSTAQSPTPVLRQNRYAQSNFSPRAATARRRQRSGRRTRSRTSRSCSAARMGRPAVTARQVPTKLASRVGCPVKPTGEGDVMARASPRTSSSRPASILRELGGYTCRPRRGARRRRSSAPGILEAILLRRLEAAIEELNPTVPECARRRSARSCVPETQSLVEEKPSASSDHRVIMSTAPRTG